MLLQNYSDSTYLMCLPYETSATARAALLRLGLGKGHWRDLMAAAFNTSDALSPGLLVYWPAPLLEVTKQNQDS